MKLKGHENSSSKFKTNQSDDSWNDDFEKFMEDRGGGRAKHVLGMPVSSVTSKVAFSMGGRGGGLSMCWVCRFRPLPRKLLLAWVGGQSIPIEVRFHQGQLKL